MESIRSGWVKAAHDCSKGGLGVALALMAIKGQLGLDVDLSKVPSKVNQEDELLFSESQARFVLSCQENEAEKILQVAKKASVPAAAIGRAADSGRFVLRNRELKLVDLSIQKMEEAWSNCIPKFMGVD